MSEKPSFTELVTIVETSNGTLLALMKSVLDGADIPYFAKGEQLQNLFGVGQIGIGFNLIVGPVRLQVRADDAQPARELLADFLATDGEEDDQPDS